jgi:CRP/FNR family transcriptional regulator, cyclic AMP receptor protein
MWPKPMCSETPRRRRLQAAIGPHPQLRTVCVIDSGSLATDPQASPHDGREALACATRITSAFGTRAAERTRAGWCVVGIKLMASETFIAPLLRVSLFQGLTEPQLAALARRAERVMFRIGQTIIRNGDAGDGAFLLIVGEGEIVGAGWSRATADDSTVVQTGSLVGEMAMLIDTTYNTTIVAKTAVRALKITRQALHVQMERDPELAAHFVAKMSSRLRNFTDELRRIESGLASGPVSDEADSAHVSRALVAQSAGASAQLLQRAG